MAYQRHTPGARALHNGFYRRRAAIRRAIRTHRARAENEPVTGHRVAQAVIIGPGGRASLQPLESASASVIETIVHPIGMATPTSSTDTTEAEDGITAIFGGETGQIALIQTQSPEETLHTSFPAPQVTAGFTPSSSSVAVITPHSAPRPTAGHNSPSIQPISSPEVVSLVVEPISGRLPPLLSTRVFSGTPSSAPSTVSPSSSSMDPNSTSVDAASEAPPLSQNPPIIVGILMVVLLCLAAIAALVSWIMRSSRRRRKNRLEAITVGGSDAQDSATYSYSFQEKDVEEGIGQLEPPRADNIQPTRPFYIEPHSGIFTHETYPNDADLHESFRSPHGAYLPSLPVTKYTLYDPPRNERILREEALPQPRVLPMPRSRVQLGLACQKEKRSLPPDTQNVSGLRHNELVAESQNKATMDDEGSLSRPDNPSTANEPVGITPPDGTKLSWASALRSNLVSALDVVKQAASDRMLPDAGPSDRPAEHSSNIVEDRFTPLALRPARKLHGLPPPRRGTAENDGLTFGGVSTSRGRKSAGSVDCKRDESEEDEEPGALHIVAKHDYPHQAAVIGGLGRFSFEQRMSKQCSQSQGGFKQEGRHRLVVHSTALKRRRSGMASGSGSSSHSAMGSELDGTMRKRRTGMV